jgi:hypothetical protein
MSSYVRSMIIYYEIVIIEFVNTYEVLVLHDNLIITREK